MKEGFPSRAPPAPGNVCSVGRPRAQMQLQHWDGTDTGGALAPSQFQTQAALHRDAVPADVNVKAPAARRRVHLCFEMGKHEGAQLDLTGGICPRPPEAPGAQIPAWVPCRAPGGTGSGRGLGRGLLQREDSVGHAG